MAAVLTANELVERARKLCLGGALDEAAKCYRQVLERQPQDSDALRELGSVCLLQGHPQEALGLLESALQAKPNDFDARLARANTLFALKRYPDAVAGFEEALKLKPDAAEAHHNRGAALGAQGRHAQALEGFEKAIALKPDYLDAHNSRGNALRALGRREEALKSFENAFALKPTDPTALLNQAAVLRALKRNKEALARLDQAIAIRPDLLDAHVRRGEILEKLSQHERALESCDRAIALRPELPELHMNRGVILRRLRRYEAAVASFDRALAIHPALGKAHLARAQSLIELGQFSEALPSYENAVASKSDWVGAMISHGFAFARMARFKDALRSYDQALLFEPDSELAHTNRALTLLVKGDLRSGFREFEWRLEKLDRRKRLRLLPGTRWLGQEDLEGKKILLHWEQGLGDTLQFVRFVPMLARKGAKVLLQVQAPLVPLLREFPGTEIVVGPEDPLPPYDLHSPLMSLPLALGTTVDTIPAHIPYISPTPGRIAAWSQRLGAANKPRIGIAWSGSAGHVNDRNRSMSVGNLLPLASRGVELISLQKEVRDSDRDILRAHPEIRHFGGQLEDFSDTASLVSLMDLVVSVDTSVVHLAGAMGKPVWLLLPHPPDWRWLLDREDSPWYPTARLFRQSRFGEWDAVIHRLAEELPRFLASSERPVTATDKPAGTLQKKRSSVRRRRSAHVKQ